ncbi:hypothetical protein QYF36_015181 [Acer negundo]|nr:hypothetical protein QYF36_015181 [Acer negundo]
MICNGEFSDKDPEEALEYLDLQAKNAPNWDIVGTHKAPSKAQPPTSGGGMYNLKEKHDLQARFTSLASKSNPKGQHNLEDRSPGSQHMDQVKSVITLRNDKVVEKYILEPCEKDDESVSKGK